MTPVISCHDLGGTVTNSIYNANFMTSGANALLKPEVQKLQNIHILIRTIKCNNLLKISHLEKRQVKIFNL